MHAITLAQPNSIPTGNVWLCGWGSTSTTTTPIMPDKLQHVMLNIMDLKSCNQSVIKMTGSSPIDETNICTGSPDRKSSCSVCARYSANSMNNSIIYIAGNQCSNLMYCF